MTNGGRQSDSLETAARDSAKALEGYGKLSSTPIFRKLMNFIHDDMSDVLQMTLHQLPRENRLERFWGRDEDVWRGRSLLSPFGLRRVAMADRGGQLCGRDETPNAVDHVPV